MKFILIILAIYIIWQLTKRYLIPIFFGIVTREVKRKLDKEIKKSQRTPKSPKAKTTAKKKTVVGEYVEFEEINDETKK